MANIALKYLSYGIISALSHFKGAIHVKHILDLRDFHRKIREIFFEILQLLNFLS